MITRTFAKRWAERIFIVGSSVAYDEIRIRPVLKTFAGMTPETAFEEVEPHFDTKIQSVSAGTWTFVPYQAQPLRLPYIKTAAKEWENLDEEAAGPFKWVAVYGIINLEESDEYSELMWVTEIDEVSLNTHDKLIIEEGIRFQLDNI